MDTKVDINKLWKDLSESAREMASYGLQTASRALDYTAGTLSQLKDEVAKTAEKLRPEKKEETPPTDK